MVATDRAERPLFIGFLDVLVVRSADCDGALPENDGFRLVETMAARRHPLRSHIIGLFQRGEIASIREAVLICDASRQAVAKWLRVAGIDIEARRMGYVARQRERAQRILEGKPPPRRPSKAQMRKQIADAMAETKRRSRGHDQAYR